MMDRSPQASAPWCCEVTHAAADIRTEADMIVESYLPAQQRIAGPYGVQHGVIHVHQEEPQQSELVYAPTAAQRLHERSEAKRSTSPVSDNDVCNSSSLERLHSLTESHSGNTIVLSSAARFSCAAADASLPVTRVGPAVTSSHSTTAVQGRYIIEKSFRCLPYLQRVSSTAEQNTDARGPELEAASLDAPNYTARIEPAGTQTVKPPAATAADIEVERSVSAQPAFTQGQEAVARPSVEELPAVAWKATVADLLSGGQKGAPFSENDPIGRDSQKEQLKRCHRRREHVRRSRPPTPEGLCTREANTKEFASDQVPSHPGGKTANGQLSRPQLSSSWSLRPAGAHAEAAYQRDDAFAAGRGAKEQVGKRQHEEQMDTVPVDTGAGAPSQALGASNGEPGSIIAGAVVAGNERAASPRDTCNSEVGTVQSDAHIQDATVRETGESEAATEQGHSVAFLSATFAHTNSHRVGETSSNKSETNAHSCCRSEESDAEGCGVSNVSREETQNSIRDNPWSRSSTEIAKSVYCEKCLSLSGCVEHQVDTRIEEGSPLCKGGGRVARRRSNNCTCRARSFCCTVEDVPRTGLSNNRTRDIAGAGGAVELDTALFHRRDCQTTEERRSSRDKKVCNGGARREEKPWHGSLGQSACTGGASGVTRFSWLFSALLKIVFLLPYCVARVRSRIGQHECGPLRAGGAGNTATYIEEDSVARPGLKQKSSQLPADGKHQQHSEQQKRDVDRTTDKGRHGLDSSGATASEEEKAHTAEESRALFECCTPSSRVPVSTPLGLSRYVLLCVYTLQAFLTGCVYFGWPALSSMLYRSGAYAWLCSPSEITRAGSDSGAPAEAANASASAPAAGSRPYFCNAQDAAVAPLFTVSHVAECVTCMVAGYLTDRYSPKGVCMFGQSLHVVGWTLLACSSVHFPAYVPAMVFIGCGSATAYLPLLRVALLFPRSKATTIAVLGAASTGSFAMPSILEAIWQHVGVRTNAAAAAATLATAAAISGASTVTSGDGSAEGGITSGGSGGGGGWTFTDICLLYLGIGPLCCLVLAALFLPTHRFPLVAQYQNARQRKPPSDENVADQEQRKGCCIISAIDGAPVSNPSTATGADSLDPSSKTETEEEGSNNSSVTPTWKAWNMCGHSSNCKQQCVRLQRQLTRRGVHRSRHSRSTFYRRREQEHDCEPSQICRVRETHGIERCPHEQRVARTEESGYCQVGKLVERQALGSSCESSEFRVSVSEDRDMTRHRKEENSVTKACIGGIVDGGIQPPVEDKITGRHWLDCVCSIDPYVKTRHGCSIERQQKIKRETCTRIAADGGRKQDAAVAAHTEKRAAGLRFSCRETWEEGDASRRRQARRGNPPVALHAAKALPDGSSREKESSLKGTHFLVDFFTCKNQRHSPAGNKEGAAHRTRNNRRSSDVRSGVSLAASPPLRLTLARLQPPCSLHQEEATSTTSQAGKWQERHSEPACVRVSRGTEEPLRREGRDCGSALDRDTQTGKNVRREGAQLTGCRRRRSAAAGRRRESRNRTPLEEHVTERGKGKEGRKRPWLSRRNFAPCELCASPAFDRRLALRGKQAGYGDDIEGTQQNKGVVGRRCHARDEDNLDYRCPQVDTADSEEFFRPTAPRPRGACTPADRPSHSAGQQKASSTGGTAAPQTGSGGGRFSRTLSLNNYYVAPLPCVQKLPGSCRPTAATEAITAPTIEGGRPAAAEPRAVIAAPEEALAVATACSTSPPEKTPSDAPSAIALSPAVTGTTTAASGAAEISQSQESRSCAECNADGTACAAPRVPFDTSSLVEPAFSSTPELTRARCVFVCAGAASDPSVESALSCVEPPSKKATFFSQCLSVHFACLMLYSGIVSVALSFMQSSSSRLFSANVLAFMDWALPFSFIPCILLGRLVDILGPFPVLLFVNSMGLLSYLCAASTPLQGVHYVSVLAFCVYVSLDSEQIYCYVEYTFRPEHFGRLSGLLLAIDGTMSLVSIPLYDHLTVRNLGGNPLPVAFGISGMLVVAYFLLAGLWLHRRKYPDPFGLLDGNEIGNACSKSRAAQREEQGAEVGS